MQHEKTVQPSAAEKAQYHPTLADVLEAEDAADVAARAAMPVHADNAAALAAGLTAGQEYRTGDSVKVVHA